MPERKFKGWRIDCEEIQGEGAYLVLSRPSYEHVKEAHDTDETEGDDLFIASLKLIASIFVEWNWADDNGDALPGLDEDPDLIFKLPWQEQIFLVNAFNELGQEQEKN